MGCDNSIILNQQEGEFLNFIFKTGEQDYNLVGKKVAFIGSKMYYFESTRKDSIIVGGSNLYIFNAIQQKESGGYDAAITYWKKIQIPMQDIIKKLKDRGPIEMLRE